MKLPKKTKIESVDTNIFAYLTEDGKVVKNPEIGQEYVVLRRISGGSSEPIILVGASGACEKHISEPCYIIEFCSGYKQIRYVYPSKFCEFCNESYAPLMLEKANLQDANLRGANLRDANLRDANLQDANLSYANLQDANLVGANLRGADFMGTNLMEANLRGTDLLGTTLRDANLMDANIQDANLRDANLMGANLRDANLRGTNLMEAIYNDDTLFSENFNPNEHGMIKVRRDEEWIE